MGTDIKVIGEIKNHKVFIAPCKWARSTLKHKCNKGSKCKNFVYGTLINDEDPQIIGWCQDMDTSEKRAVAWVKMMSTINMTPHPPSDYAKSRRMGSEVHPGYV